MKYIVSILFFTLLSFSITSSADTSENFVDAQAENLYQQGLLTKEKNNYALVVYVKSDDCPYCKHMEKTTFVNPEVLNIWKDFYVVELNLSRNEDIIDFKKEHTNEEFFAHEHSALSTPAFLIFSYDGKLFHRSTGYLDEITMIMYGDTLQKAIVAANKDEDL